MKKFEGVLFYTDLDGTLFCDDKTIYLEFISTKGVGTACA